MTEQRIKRRREWYNRLKREGYGSKCATWLKDLSDDHVEYSITYIQANPHIRFFTGNYQIITLKEVLRRYDQTKTNQSTQIKRD